MTDEEKQQAEAYIKLSENVRELIIDTVRNELLTNPNGILAGQLKMLIQQTTNDEMKQYRITRIGQTAMQYP